MIRPDSIVTIYGPGLLGGSLALAVQRYLPQCQLRLWARRDSAEAGIRARGIEAEFFTDAKAAAEGAHLLILCTPVETMADQARQIAQATLGEAAIVTDVGSVKGSVVQALEPLLGSRFIGSHPMAGSEKTGIETAQAELFQNAACLLTPTAQTDPERLSSLNHFWKALGCRVIEMTPEQHDISVARISHLPHLMAAVTTLAALRTQPEALRCAANGFRDTTRVAAGDPGLWTGIVLQNQPAILQRLKDATAVMRELVEILEKPDEETLRQWLTEAKNLRDRLPSAVAPPYGPA